MPKLIHMLLLIVFLVSGPGWLVWRAMPRAPSVVDALGGSSNLLAKSRNEQQLVKNRIRSRWKSQNTRGGFVSAQARSPSGIAESNLGKLEAESEGRWQIKKGADGFVRKMTDGRYPSLASTPEESSRQFLQRFGRLVFGIDPAFAGPPEVIREAGSTQVIIPIEVNGLPVRGARHNQIYASDGSLIYLATDPIPTFIPSPVPKLTIAEAAVYAREGLLTFLGGADRAKDGRVYPLSLFLEKGRLSYRLKNETLSLVYWFELSLPLPIFADIETVVDANLGTAVVVHNISKR